MMGQYFFNTINELQSILDKKKFVRRCIWFLKNKLMNLKINYENKKSLEILKSLIKLNYKFQTKFGKINIASIFLIELYKYLDSSVKSIIYKSGAKKKKNFFPFVDYKYLNKNVHFDLKKNLDIPFLKSMKLEKLLILIKLIFIKFLTLILQIKINIILKIIVFTKSKKNFFFKKIFIKDREIQLILVNKFLKDFAKINKITNKHYSINFINYINMFITDTPKIIQNKKY